VRESSPSRAISRGGREGAPTKRGSSSTRVRVDSPIPHWCVTESELERGMDLVLRTPRSSPRNLSARPKPEPPAGRGPACSPLRERVREGGGVSLKCSSEPKAIDEPSDRCEPLEGAQNPFRSNQLALQGRRGLPGCDFVPNAHHRGWASDSLLSPFHIPEWSSPCGKAHGR